MMDLAVKMIDFVVTMMDFVVNVMKISGAEDPGVQAAPFTLRKCTVSENEEVCIKNKELCIKNEEFCIKNEAFCIKNDDCLQAVQRYGSTILVQAADTTPKDALRVSAF